MFKVGITKDFLNEAGQLTYKSIGLDILAEQPEIQYEFLSEHRSPLTPELISGYDAIISLTPGYNADSFKGVTQLKAICRFGVGYDMVDVEACTNAGVMLTITKGAVNYSVAEATIGWMLALSHKMVTKDRLVREGKWAQRKDHMGAELRGKTLGIIGMGGIGSTLVQMLQPFRMGKIIAFDPYADPKAAASIGVKLVGLDELMREADFVSVNCPLTDETRDMIGKKQLSLLKPSAFIINTARGGIINHGALLDILQRKAIAGYATDVFDEEPPSPEDPLFQQENVMVAPHCIAWTDELFEEIGSTACRQVVQIFKGETPDFLVNPEVLG